MLTLVETFSLSHSALARATSLRGSWCYSTRDFSKYTASHSSRNLWPWAIQCCWLCWRNLCLGTTKTSIHWTQGRFPFSLLSPSRHCGRDGAHWCQSRVQSPGRTLDQRESRRASTAFEEANTTDSILKAGLHLGPDVDFELYAQYLWKRQTNWKTRPPEGRAPGLILRLSVA